ncbi:MAG TPA: hypothetical protein VF411_12675 [Bacteroidia bacterium]
MTIFEYIRLNKEARAEVLSSKGVFIESYADLGSSINLYYLSSFFVEVTLDSNKNITDITPFMRGYRTDKYKDDINSTATA